MKKRLSISFTGIFLAIFFLTNCVHNRETTRLMNYQFPDARVDTVMAGNRIINYMSLSRNDSLPTIFFLHGSPSSMTVYNLYYGDQDLAQWSNIITADRPGYGLSGLGRSERSVRRQAEKMWKILEKEGLPSPLYLLGSSYGGTVAAKMAMMHPERVDGILLISASLAPGLEHTYRISYLIQHPPFRWILPGMLRTANDEKLAHRVALEKMEPYWDRITAPVVLFHGSADKLIFPENASFAIERLVNSINVESLSLEGEGHFLQIRYKDMILSNMRDMMIRNGHFIDQHFNQVASDKTPSGIETLLMDQ
jgi:pimeloyl-ACP methyl ester carboxylesterase